MRPGRTTSAAEFADCLSLEHHIARIYQAPRQMSVTCSQPVAVVNFDHVTIIGVVNALVNHPSRRRLHDGPCRGAEIYSFMLRLTTGKRINPMTEVGRKVSLNNRQHRR